MKCQKCAKSAVVHLTDIVHDAEGMKHQVEVHLCLTHAIDAGLVAPGTQLAPKPSNIEAPKDLTIIKPKTTAPVANVPAAPEPPAAIVPIEPASTGLTVSRKPAQPSQPADPNACPICGTTWAQFKQQGLMGCPNDYTFFESKLLPIIRRTQENATDHAGKLPTKVRHTAPAQAITIARLRRELQKAIDSENYERAAKLRDQLKSLEPQ